MKQSIINLLKENKEKLITGSFIAKKMNVTRSYINKIISMLITEGYDIKSVNRSGYIYYSDIRVLNKEKILSQLDNKHNIVLLEEVDSTNNYAKKMAKDEAIDDAIIIANSQTFGRGRLGRSFESNKSSGIYMSILLKPTFSLEYAKKITCLASVAVSKAIDKLTGLSSKIKWVNDIYINNKKVSGILTEASTLVEEGKLEYVVIGIGINTYTQVFSDELIKIATTLENEAQMVISRCDLIVNVINYIDYYLSHIEENIFMDEYIEKSFVIGNTVELTKYDKKYLVEVVGISKDGELIIKKEDGTKEYVSSGEITRLKVNYEQEY